LGGGRNSIGHARWGELSVWINERKTKHGQTLTRLKEAEGPFCRLSGLNKVRKVWGIRSELWTEMCKKRNCSSKLGGRTCQYVGKNRDQFARPGDILGNRLRGTFGQEKKNPLELKMTKTEVE